MVHHHLGSPAKGSHDGDRNGHRLGLSLFSSLVAVGPTLAVAAALFVSRAPPSTVSGEVSASLGGAAPVPGDTGGTGGQDIAGVYLRSCGVCHGSAGEGTDRGPRIVDSGSALVDYMLSTGRMPIPDPETPLERHSPAFDDATRAALVDYIEGFGGNGPPIPAVDLSDADAARGGEQFRLNCAACHSAAGSGGALLDQAAPSLRQSTSLQVAEAIRGGPTPMPKFGTAALSDQQVNDVAAYVGTLQPPNHRGGFGLDYLGPFSEGAIAWVFGLGLLIVAVILIERRTS